MPWMTPESGRLYDNGTAFLKRLIGRRSADQMADVQRIDIAVLAVQGADDHESIARLAPLLFRSELVYFVEQLG